MSISGDFREFQECSSVSRSFGDVLEVIRDSQEVFVSAQYFFGGVQEHMLYFKGVARSFRGVGCKCVPRGFMDLPKSCLGIPSYFTWNRFKENLRDFSFH